MIELNWLSIKPHLLVLTKIQWHLAGFGDQVPLRKYLNSKKKSRE